MDSLVLDTVIGLIFVFAAFSSVVTIITEMIARFLGLRGEYLMRGLRTLLDGGGTFELRLQDILKWGQTEGAPDSKTAPQADAGPAADAVAAAATSPAAKAMDPGQPMITTMLSTRLLAPFADKGKMPPQAGNAALANPTRRSLPSYISARSFAQALIGLLVPDPTAATAMAQVHTALANLPHPALRSALQPLAAQAENDIAKFRVGIEHWYDDQMDRVSGWYSRHVRWISLAIGVFLVLAFNLNAVTVARTIYTDEALRSAVVTEAADAAACGTKEPAACLTELRAQVTKIQDSGFPIGWGSVPECAAVDTIRPACSFWQAHGFTDPDPNAGFNFWLVVVLLTGWALMILALLPGARFWFDVLSRLGTLRSSGPKPDRAAAR